MAHSCTAKNLNRSIGHTGKHEEALQLNNRRMPDNPSVHRAGVQATRMHLGYGQFVARRSRASLSPTLCDPQAHITDPTKAGRATPLTHSQHARQPQGTETPEIPPSNPNPSQHKAQNKSPPNARERLHAAIATQSQQSTTPLRSQKPCLTRRGSRGRPPARRPP